MMNNATVVNGIVLPDRVAAELRRLGIALSWYTSGELEDAVAACSIDGQLIDDIDGINFHDKLALLPNEHRTGFYGYGQLDSESENEKYPFSASIS